MKWSGPDLNRRTDSLCFEAKKGQVGRQEQIIKLRHHFDTWAAVRIGRTQTPETESLKNQKKQLHV